jgi:hypothetical protein
MTKSGAEELVAKIKFYWAQRGYSPVIRIEPEHSGFVIRSELRGAMPPADKGIPA